MKRALLVVVSSAIACAVSTPIGDLEQAATDPGGGTGSSSNASTTDEAATAVSVTSTVTTSGPASATSVASSGETGMIGPGPMRAFSIRSGDIPPDGEGSSDVASDTAGVDPDGILVVITTGEATCEEPFGQLQCGGAWNIHFTIPLGLQTPGSYALADDLNGSASETDAGPECGFGGGTLDGTAEIDVIDATRVAGRIVDATSPFGFDPNVEFDAPRCP